MTQHDDNVRYERRMRERGYVRKGFRIPAEAAERLRVLAFLHGLNSSEVVSRLLLGEPLGTTNLSIVANPYGFSDAEARDFERHREGWKA